MFVIKAISTDLFYTFSCNKIYDFGICWILAYKAGQDIPRIVIQLCVCFVISRIVTLVCYGILHVYVSMKNVVHECYLLGNDSYVLDHYVILG